MYIIQQHESFKMFITDVIIFSSFVCYSVIRYKYLQSNVQSPFIKPDQSNLKNIALVLKSVKRLQGAMPRIRLLRRRSGKDEDVSPLVGQVDEICLSVNEIMSQLNCL
jgi:hypothetical protein